MRLVEAFGERKKAGIVINIAREGQLELAKSSDSAAIYPGLCSSAVGPVCSVARASS